MSDLAHLKIWNDPAIRDSLSWYLNVAENRRPAKFRIAATLATQTDPAASSEDTLWAELERLTPVFLGRWRAIRAGAPLPATTDGPRLREIGGGVMLTVMQIARRIPWVIMGLILAGGLLHFFGPAELERDELIVIGALIVGLICFQVWLRRRGV